MKIAVKLSIVNIVISLILTLALYLAYSKLTYNRFLNSEKIKIKETGRATLTAIYSLLSERESDIKIISYTIEQLLKLHDSKNLTKYLLKIKQSYNAYLSLTIVNSSGIVIADTSSTVVNYKYQGNLSFLFKEGSLVKNLDDTSVHLVKDYRTKKDIVGFIRPLIFDNKRYYIVSRVPVEGIHNIIDALNTGLSLYKPKIILVTHDKGIILDTDANETAPDYNDNLIFNIAAQPLVHLKTTDYFHLKYIFKKSVFENVFKSTNHDIIILSLLFAIIYFLCSIFSFKLIFSPFKKIIRLSESISDGDYSKRAENLPKDELGSLGNTVNQMIESVEVKIKQVDSLNNKLKEAEKSGNLGFWDNNLESGIIYWSDQMYRFINEDPQSFTPGPDTYKQYIHPNDLDALIEQIEKSVKNKTKLDMSHRIIASDGSVKYVNESIHNIYDKDGKILRSFGTVRDITSEHMQKQKIKKAVFDVFLVISRALEVKDSYTKGHELRVANLSVQLAKKNGWKNEERLLGLYLAALVHDIGKIAISSELLEKKEPLRKEEFSELRKHSEYSYEIFKIVDLPWDIKTIVRQHHERCDGSGYPLGLTGDRILDEAKIIGICDTFEAMVNNRPYRKALGVSKAVEAIQAGCGSLFDEKMTRAFLNMVKYGEYDMEKVPEEFVSESFIILS